MSDLTTTNCGCNDGGTFGNFNSCIWIILLLACCGNGGSCGNGCFGNDCSSIIWIIILLSCCGCGGGLFN